MRTVDLLTEIASRYYLQSESQVEIARGLGLDPSTVSRYLKRAREEGIVHVEIRPPLRRHVDLGRELAARYDLARVVVAPTGPETTDILGTVAADFLESLLRSEMRLGVSWGRTLASVVDNLRPGVVANLSIAQLSGGVDDPAPGIQGHELVRGLADLFPGSHVHYLHAPTIVGSLGIRRALLSDSSIQAALAAARSSELALVGIGQMGDEATLVRGRHVSLEDWSALRAAGAVGNMNTRFFDSLGRPIGNLEQRTIAIEWQELRAIPTVVAVAAGIDKVAAIDGALRTGCADILVTDEATASALIDRG